MAMPSHEMMIPLETPIMLSRETMILEHVKIPLEKTTMPSRETMLLEHAKILLEKPTMPSRETMIMPVQDKTQAMLFCKSMI